MVWTLLLPNSQPHVESKVFSLLLRKFEAEDIHRMLRKNAVKMLAEEGGAPVFYFVC